LVEGAGFVEAAGSFDPRRLRAASCASRAVTDGRPVFGFAFARGGFAAPSWARRGERPIAGFDAASLVADAVPSGAIASVAASFLGATAR